MVSTCWFVKANTLRYWLLLVWRVGACTETKYEIVAPIQIIWMIDMKPDREHECSDLIPSSQ